MLEEEGWRSLFVLTNVIKPVDSIKYVHMLFYVLIKT